MQRNVDVEAEPVDPAEDGVASGRALRRDRHRRPLDRRLSPTAAPGPGASTESELDVLKASQSRFSHQAWLSSRRAGLSHDVSESLFARRDGSDPPDHCRTDVPPPRQVCARLSGLRGGEFGLRKPRRRDSLLQSQQGE